MSHPIYQQSQKGTQRTGANLSNHAQPPEADPNPNITDLFKQDSVSSDKPVAYLLPQNHNLQYLDAGDEDAQHSEIRKFMRKADKLNEVSYRKLHEGKALVPESSSINLYKSSKNVLEEFNLPYHRDRQIRSIYLKGGKQSKTGPNASNRTKKNIKNYSTLKRKLTTDSKLVQTDTINVNNNGQQEDEVHYRSATKANRTIGMGNPFPSKLKKTLKAIEQDDDQQFIPVKRKNPQRMFNTISITAQITRNKVDPNLYLNNVAKAQHQFNRTVRRYSIKQEKQYQQNTVYGSSEHGFGKSGGFLQPIVNQPVSNPWESQVVDKRKGKQEEVLPVIRERSSLQEDSKKNTQSNKQTQMTKRNKEKQSRSVQNGEHQTTQNSLFVQNNNSVKRSRISDAQFTAIRATQSNNFDEKQSSGFKFTGKISSRAPPVEQSEIFVQVPQVHEIAIGTDTNNFIVGSKKPLHPISIGFSQNEANWIASQYKPKSQFLRNVDTGAFSIKKYRNGVYFGQLSEEGHKHGKGVVFYFNGRSYQGNFVHDLKQGKGYQYMPDGSIYAGEFKKGLKQGKGMFEWPNGEVYDGQWIAGQKNGSGMWKSPKGDTYLGEWKNNKIEGFGVLTIKEGDRYEGQFKNSMKNGLGTQRYSNGDTYVGQFSKNRPNGQGEYYYQSGDVYRGTFSNGLKHGNGYLKTEKGTIYQGQFRNEKKCGYGQETDAEGYTYKGNFQNDLKHGYGQQTDQNGIIVKGYWINGHEVQTDMGAIMEDELDREESIANIKGKTKKHGNGGNKVSNQPRNRLENKKSPLKSPKMSKSKEKALSPSDPNFHRTCGCRRKH